MTYSIIGILATILLLITNRELFWNTENKALTGMQRDYRGFLLGALAYLITDMLWGILESHKLTAILYADIVPLITGDVAGTLTPDESGFLLNSICRYAHYHTDLLSDRGSAYRASVHGCIS